MKLKTLKDITSHNRADGEIVESYIPDIKDLRLEAIKRIKHFLKKMNCEVLKINKNYDVYQGIEFKRIGGYHGKVDFDIILGRVLELIDFNNISEVDLK